LGVDHILVLDDLSPVEDNVNNHDPPTVEARDN